jgi:hypothetical protein
MSLITRNRRQNHANRFVVLSLNPDPRTFGSSTVPQENSKSSFGAMPRQVGGMMPDGPSSQKTGEKRKIFTANSKFGK